MSFRRQTRNSAQTEKNTNLGGNTKAKKKQKKRESKYKKTVKTKEQKQVVWRGKIGEKEEKETLKTKESTKKQRSNYFSSNSRRKEYRTSLK